MVITLTVPLASPSLNQTLRMHWATRRLFKRAWLAHLRVAAAKTGQGEDRARMRATGKRLLLIERYGKRSLDQDNLVGGCKEVITDNLRQMGLLVDDTDEWVTIEALNMHGVNGERTKTPFTRITLTDL